jgi:hypothetical protein
MTGSVPSDSPAFAALCTSTTSQCAEHQICKAQEDSLANACRFVDQSTLQACLQIDHFMTANSPVICVVINSLDAADTCQLPVADEVGELVSIAL